MQIHHYTLNTGHGRLTDRCEVEDTILDLLEPLVKASGRSHIPNTDFSIVFSRGETGGWMFTVSWSGFPLVECGLAMNEQQAGEVWAPLLELAEKLHLPRPKEPPPVPWLCVVVLPTAPLADKETLGMVADLERCLAWTIIERVDCQ